MAKDDGQKYKSRRNYLRGCGALGAVAVAGCLSDDDTESLKLAGGSSGSTEFAGGQVFASIVHDELNDIDLTVQSASGTVEHFRLMDDDQVDLAIGPIEMMYNALHERPPFEEEPVDLLPDAGFCMGIYGGYLMAVEGSGIESYEDLPGKNVWPFWPGSGFRTFYELVLGDEFLDVWDDIDVINADPGEIAGLISEGRVDAFGAFDVSGNIGLYNEELDGRSDIDFYPVHISEENAAPILENEMPQFEIAPIEGWSRDFVGEEVLRGLSLNTMMFLPEVSDDVAYDLTRVAHENGQRLQEDATVFPDISDPDTLTASNTEFLPIHPGVAEYYREIGAWDDSWQEG